MGRFQIPGPELARLTHNALAFMPARSAVKVCRVHQNIGSLSIMATDIYSLGYDSASVETENDTAQIDLCRADLVELDKIARARKKDAVEIDIRHQDGLSILDDNGAWMPMRDASEQRNPVDLWDRCYDLLTRETPTRLVLIDPKMMAAFGKIKAAGETIADLSISDGDEQISVKIGSTFVGAIMPVDRYTAAQSEEIGAEGLWPSI